MWPYGWGNTVDFVFAGIRGQNLGLDFHISFTSALKVLKIFQKKNKYTFSTAKVVLVKVSCHVFAMCNKTFWEVVQSIPMWLLRVVGWLTNKKGQKKPVLEFSISPKQLHLKYTFNKFKHFLRNEHRTLALLTELLTLLCLFEHLNQPETAPLSNHWLWEGVTMKNGVSI